MHCPKREESSSTTPERFSLDLGDCIGVESCVDLRSDLSVLEQEIISENQSHKCSRDKKSRRTKMMMMEKEYPPPIPWLARTENLPSHMPWVMIRYHTDDGRLIIREEKVKRHEYFQAHRSNGRLTLRLVCDVDNDNTDDDDEEEEERNGNVHEDGEVNGSVDDVMVAEVTTTENQTLEEDGEESISNPSSESCMEKCSGSGCGSGGECYKSVRKNSGIFEMTLPTFRPVHT